MKKFLSLVIAMAMLSTMAFAAVPSDFSDIPNDWSKTAIENAITNGLLNGAHGKINASDNLTRAEMCAIIVRAAQAQKIVKIRFIDVNASDWFYNEVAKAVGMEVFFGSGDKANPRAPITREETMAIVARFLKLANVGTDAVLGEFGDAGNVSGWAKDSVAALINSGYIKGSNGKINPKANITRAEFAAIMDRVVTTYTSEAGTVIKNLGNTMINAIDGGVELKDMTINGDLIIGDGVGSGIITLNNVKVTGRILVRGGATVKIVGGTINKVDVASDNSTVRVSASTSYTESNGVVLEDAVDSEIIVEKPSSGGSGGGGSGGSGGGPSTQEPDEIISYKMTVAGASVNGVVTGDATVGYTVTVDLSGNNATDMITTGIADTKYSSKLVIGGKNVPTDANVTINQLIGIIGSSSTKTQISVGALALMMADLNTYKETIRAQTGKYPTEGAVEIIEGGFKVNATMTRGDNKTKVTFVFKF